LSQDWHIDARDERVDSALVRSLALFRSTARYSMHRTRKYQALRKELVRYREAWRRRGRLDARAFRDALSSRVSLNPRIGSRRSPIASRGRTRARLFPRPPDSSSGAASARQGPGSPRGIYDRDARGRRGAIQSRHGIVIDSILGKETVDALNVPVSFRLGQIA